MREIGLNSYHGCGLHLALRDQAPNTFPLAGSPGGVSGAFSIPLKRFVFLSRINKHERLVHAVVRACADFVVCMHVSSQHFAHKHCRYNCLLYKKRPYFVSSVLWTAQRTECQGDRFGDRPEARMPLSSFPQYDITRRCCNGLPLEIGLKYTTPYRGAK